MWHWRQARPRGTLHSHMPRIKIDLPEKLRVRGRGRVKLKDVSAAHTHGWKEAQARAATLQLADELGELQYKLYADRRYGVLVVLQAIDGGGKDSTLRHVFSALNPQGCTVHAFKAPSPEELRHDYLWRVHPHVPPRGEIAVFNRSHYEDVLVVRVDNLVPRSGVAGALPPDQRIRAHAGRNRHPRRQAVPAHEPCRAEAPLRGAYR